MARLRLGHEVGPDVDGVEAEEDDGRRRACPGPLEGHEGDGDGQTVGEQEVAHVLADDDRLDVQRGRPSCRRRESSRTATPVTNMASVASMNGAPRMAPMPTSSLVSAPPAEDGHDRDHRLGQGRADGGQDGADRALGQVQLAAHPLDAVGEQLGADEDDGERDRTGRGASPSSVRDARDNDGQARAAASTARAVQRRPSVARPGEPEGGNKDRGRRDDRRQPDARPDEGLGLEADDARSASRPRAGGALGPGRGSTPVTSIRTTPARRSTKAARAPMS